MLPPLVLWPSPILKRVSGSVINFDDIEDLAGQMLQTMKQHNGVGLSAIQVDVLLRVVVSRFEDPMVNPVLIGYNVERELVKEGCLSLPGFFEQIRRFPQVQIAYQDVKGVKHVGTYSGLAAQCFQHELEHLDGHFFTDHLPKADRSRILGEVQKLKRAGKYGK